MQIVLVDPSRAVQRIMTQLIEPGQHRVFAFNRSHDALDFVAANRDVRAFITSGEIDGISGVELCAEARRAAGPHRPLYIILMSSLDDPRLLVKALDNGADDFIRKPPIAEELQARLRLADRVTSMQRELVRHATTDFLTGLLNRRAFFDTAKETCKRAEGGKPVSVIIFDIDHFKHVNDTYGHNVGDVVLATVAAQARTVGGTAVRLGGEEFGILLERDLVDAIGLAEDLRRSVRALSFAEHGSFAISCSLGVAEWKEGDTVDRLLRRADMALYQAKTSGRDRVVAADSFLVTKDHEDWQGAARKGGRLG
ncbi:MAG TPA: diguanylate cyclase [Xanthobacteraceae bacterium]|nr:diguanylate cyclase [Xanthobacteraceae bacterium]